MFGAFENQKDEIDKELSDVNQVFRKHIFLGMLIFLGSMLIFLAGEFLTVLMGVASAMHQLANNVYIFLLFKQNNYVYAKLCCRFGQNKRKSQLEMHLAAGMRRNQPQIERERGRSEGSTKSSEYPTTTMSPQIVYGNSNDDNITHFGMLLYE